MIEQNLPIKPIKHDKHGPAYSPKDLNNYLYKELVMGVKDNIIYRDGKKIMQTNEEVIKDITECSETVARLLKKWDSLTDESLQSIRTKTSKIKDVQSQLSTAIANVEKTVKHEQLEKLVNHAERLSAALKTLSELNQNPELANLLSLLKGK